MSVSNVAKASGASTTHMTVAPGVKLAYTDQGAGQAVVFATGWTFTKACFEKQTGPLSAKYRVITYDPRSQGDSSTVLEGNDYMTHAQDLATLLDRLEVKNPVLVGWSSGAHTTLGLIQLRGADSVAAHVCIDTPPKPLSSSPDAWVEGSLDEIAAIHTLYLRDAKGVADYIRIFAETRMVQRALSPEELAWITGQSAKCKPLIAAQLFASHMFGDSTLPAVSVAKLRPTLYFIAEHWSKTAIPFLQRFLPETKYVVFGGHMMFWEHPEAFNHVLDEFIQNALYGTSVKIRDVMA